MLQAETGVVEADYQPGESWPPEVRMIISSLEAARGKRPYHRRFGRMEYPVTAQLRLFSDVPHARPWLLYSRDINQRGMGFITPHRLPLGYGGMLDVPFPDGRRVNVYCTLLRCRQAILSWYEGALYFNRDQLAFSIAPIQPEVQQGA
ncbi:MAG TPA: PilZ domain-containing protein [Tepidisphaeraceae bacterium]